MGQDSPTTIIQTITYKDETIRLFFHPGENQPFTHDGNSNVMAQLKKDFPGGYQINPTDGNIYAKLPNNPVPQSIGRFEQTQVVNGREVPYTPPPEPAQAPQPPQAGSQTQTTTTTQPATPIQGVDNPVVQTFTYKGNTTKLYVKPGDDSSYYQENVSALAQLKKDYPDFQIGNDGKIYAKVPGHATPQPVGEFKQTQFVNGREVPYTSTPKPASGSSSQAFDDSALNQRTAEYEVQSAASKEFLRLSNETNDPETAAYYLREHKRTAALAAEAKADIDKLKSKQADQRVAEGGSAPTGEKPSIKERLMANKMGTLMAGTAALAMFGAAFKAGEKFTMDSGIGMITSLGMFANYMKELGFTANQGLMVGGIIIAAGMILSAIKKWIKEHGEKQDQDLNTAQGDVPQIPSTAPTSGATSQGANTSSTSGNNTASGSNTTSTGASSTDKRWYEYLPKENIFMIMAGVSALTFGASTMDLSSGIKSDAGFTFNQASMPAITQTLQAAVDGKKKIGSSVAGKIFIKQGNGIDDPDKVVYFTQEPTGTTTNGVPDMVYRANLISINAGGYALGPSPMSMIPFFMVEKKTNAIVATASVNDLLARQTAMAQTSVSGISPRNAMTAARMGAAQGHAVDSY
jgi:hypothetical protein